MRRNLSLTKLQMDPYQIGPQTITDQRNATLFARPSSAMFYISLPLSSNLVSCDGPYYLKVCITLKIVFIWYSNLLSLQFYRLVFFHGFRYRKPSDRLYCSWSQIHYRIATSRFCQSSRLWFSIFGRSCTSSKVRYN